MASNNPQEGHHTPSGERLLQQTMVPDVSGEAPDTCFLSGHMIYQPLSTHAFTTYRSVHWVLVVVWHVWCSRGSNVKRTFCHMTWR